MAFRCYNCNGSMVFDIASQQMKCSHCGSVCAPEDFDLRDVSAGESAGTNQCPHCCADLTAEEQAGERCPYCGGALPQVVSSEPTIARFACQNCGAELEGTDDSLIGVCPYCGSQSMLKAVGGLEHRVERLIPFQVTREQCAKAYENYAKKIRYLPRELKDPAYLQKFTGIYMPYYEYDAEFGAAEITGSKTVEKHSRYDLVYTYSVPAEIYGEYRRGTPFDASRYLDDQISARAMPFDTTREVAFHPAYLAGSYADASTVAPELYLSDAKAQAERDMIGAISDQVMEDHGFSVTAASKIDTTVTGHHSVLFPMWFLTWRKNDRVAYAVVNGESGSVVSDLPLDLKAFGKGCGLMAAVVFLLLELLFQPTPILTSTISLIAAICMALGILASTKQAFDKQAHTKDKGWGTASEPIKPQPETKQQKKKEQKGGGCLPVLITVLVIVLVIVLVMVLAVIQVYSDGKRSLFHLMTPLAALGVSVYALVKVRKWQKHIDQRDPMISAGILLLTVVLNTAIVYISPVSDLWYYAGDGVCIAGLVLASIGMLRVYNTSTTRPLPKLFDRNEV